MSTTRTGQCSTVEERRKAVIEATIAEFGEHACHATSTAAIAQHAGISQPYIYALFPDKQSLFLACSPPGDASASAARSPRRRAEPSRAKRASARWAPRTSSCCRAPVSCCSSCRPSPRPAIRRCVPIVIIALFAGRALVPASRADRIPRLDQVGAVLSLAGLVALTYGLIEAPDRGWTSVATLGILGGAVALLIAFAAWEIRRDDPMVPLQVFCNGRFSAASASVMPVFFSLFGALFLLTQILQFVLGYSPLQAGAAALPFAFTVGITSPIAAILSKKRGSAKIPVATGLALMAAGLAVMANSTAGSGLGHYVFATVLMAAGMGFAMAPATDSIMGARPAAQAGVGSAVNDTTREIGGVLGVAVMGSVASSTYAHQVASALSPVPHGASETARSSLGGALTVAQHIGGPTGSHVADAAREAFVQGVSKGLLVAIVAAALGALLALRYLPARNTEAERAPQSPIAVTSAA